MADTKKASATAATKKADDSADATHEEGGPAFTEVVVAKVNQEGSHREVILRGEKSANTIVYRGAKGTSKFRDGVRYDVVFTEAAEPKEEVTGDDAKTEE